MSTPRTKKLDKVSQYERGEFDGGVDERKTVGSRDRENVLYDQKMKCPSLYNRDSGRFYPRCESRPTDLDHIIELRHGGYNEYDNYQMLCSGCHKLKTKANYSEQTIF